MQILLLILAAAAFAFGGLCMKYSQGLTRPTPTLAVFLLFGIGAACQARAMLKAEMNLIYVSVLGLEAVLASLLSVLILHERIDAPRALAIVVIVLGIALLQRT